MPLLLRTKMDEQCVTRRHRLHLPEWIFYSSNKLNGTRLIISSYHEHVKPTRDSIIWAKHDSSNSLRLIWQIDRRTRTSRLSENIVHSLPVTHFLCNLSNFTINHPRGLPRLFPLPVPILEIHRQSCVAAACTKWNNY